MFNNSQQKIIRSESSQIRKVTDPEWGGEASQCSSQGGRNTADFYLHYTPLSCQTLVPPRDFSISPHIESLQVRLHLSTLTSALENQFSRQCRSMDWQPLEPHGPSCQFSLLCWPSSQAEGSGPFTGQRDSDSTAGHVGRPQMFSPYIPNFT